MKRRDYRAFNEALITDLNAFLAQHPDAIDALLFKPDLDHPETVAAMDDVVGSMETEERALTYAAPALARIFIIPGQNPMTADDLGEGADGNMDQPVVVLINAPEVPKQSIIQYEEYIAGSPEVRAVTLYVLKSEMFGEAGMKHYCVPFQAFDFEFIEVPANVQPLNGAVLIPDELPEFIGSAFVVHGAEDTHGKSQWQVRTADGTYEVPLYDSGESPDLTFHFMGVDDLPEGSYFWRVRYRGSAGDVAGETAVWSDWSEETGFTVEAEEEE